jgi:PilZ domain
MSFSRIQRKTERRRQARKPVRAMVPILCQDEDGRESRFQARLVDISPSGVKLWLPARLPARTVVSFNSPDLGAGGRGTVRYCNAAKGGYEIGLEMSNGTGWHEENADLRNLATALGESRSPAKRTEALNALIIKKP